MKSYGPQGWWPLLDVKGTNPTKTGSIQGYHPGDYSYPKDDRQKFEICIGAILTQNTSWPNVEKALLNLDKIDAIDPKRIMKLDDKTITEAIRPAGYFNQKAKKLRIFSEYYLNLRGRTPARDDLLDVWGIGPETADSILLYAYKEPQFVVDTYTRRILKSIGIIDDKSSYDDIKTLFEREIEKKYEIYQEFHALLVEHAKHMRS